MLSNGKILIRKRSQPEWLLLIALAMSMLGGFFTDILSVPSAIKYSIDVMVGLLLVLLIMNVVKERVPVLLPMRIFLIWLGAILALCAAVYMAQYQSALYFLWGLRNNFRFYVFFFAAVLFFSVKDIRSILRVFDIFFFANTLLCFVQFFLLGLKGDFLGGFFGTEKGCNGYLNIFLVIIATKAMVFYVNKRESLGYCALKCGLMLVVSSLAELKFFFVEFLVIVVFAFFLSSLSLRKVLLVLLGVAVVLVGVTLLEQVFPWLEGFFSIDSMLSMSMDSGYGSASQLNRLTTIPVLSKQILTDPMSQMFGLGLGNCDTSTFSFLQTPFYAEHVGLRYMWFSTAFWYLETGWLGLTLFFGFFVLVFVLAFLIARKCTREHKLYCQIGMIAAVLSVLVAVYNSSLRTEAAYMLYFVLAIPFVVQKEVREHERLTEDGV